MEFIWRYLEQLDGGLTGRPRKNFPTLICKGDFEMQTSDNFSVTVVKTEATFHNPARCLVDQMTTHDMCKPSSNMAMCHVQPNASYLSTCGKGA